MMLRRPLTSCVRATPFSFATKAKAFSTLRPRATPVFTKPLQLTATTFRSSKPSVSTITRRYASFDTQVARPTDTSPLMRALYTAGVFGAAVVGLNFVFNRETREGGIPVYEREYLHESFMYTGLGVATIGFAAKALHNMGWSYKLMSMNPTMVMIVGVVGGIGTMMATFACPPENYIAKHTLWSSFNLMQAATLAPVFFYHPALIARAGLYTIALMGGISFIGATAKTDQYLWLGGPLLGGLCVVLAAGIAPMLMPRLITGRSLALMENVSLYGGLAVFGGLTLYDIQKILAHARLSERGLKPRDTINESISLELDFINIFIRMLTILSGSQRRK